MRCSISANMPSRSTHNETPVIPESSTDSLDFRQGKAWKHSFHSILPRASQIKDSVRRDRRRFRARLLIVCSRMCRVGCKDGFFVLFSSEVPRLKPSFCTQGSACKWYSFEFRTNQIRGVRTPVKCFKIIVSRSR